ncbi:MAG: mitofilin family membrane protein, partial [Candidatus Eiseniibacteriota bacterium]
HRVSTIVTVRRTGGDLAGDSAEDVVGRAERQLADNDLAGALHTLSALGGPAASAARDWLVEAHTTLDALNAVKALQDAALARIAEAGGTPK